MPGIVISAIREWVDSVTVVLKIKEQRDLIAHTTRKWQPWEFTPKLLNLQSTFSTIVLYVSSHHWQTAELLFSKEFFNGDVYHQLISVLLLLIEEIQCGE